MNNVPREARKTPWEKHAKVSYCRAFYLKNREIHRFGCIFEALLSAKPMFFDDFVRKSTTVRHFWAILPPKRVPEGRQEAKNEPTEAPGAKITNIIEFSTPQRWSKIVKTEARF